VSCSLHDPFALLDSKSSLYEKTWTKVSDPVGIRNPLSGHPAHTLYTILIYAAIKISEHYARNVNINYQFVSSINEIQNVTTRLFTQNLVSRIQANLHILRPCLRVAIKLLYRLCHALCPQTANPNHHPLTLD
jgi:hypothetical protein